MAGLLLAAAHTVKKYKLSLKNCTAKNNFDLRESAIFFSKGSYFNGFLGSDTDLNNLLGWVRSSRVVIASDCQYKH
jgi:hypothetical protein